MNLRLTTKVTALAGIVLAFALVISSFAFLRSLRSVELAELESSAHIRLEQTVDLVNSDKVTTPLRAPRDSSLMVQIVRADATIEAATQNVGDMHAMIDLVLARNWFASGRAEVAERTHVDGAPCIVVGKTVGTGPAQRLVIVAAPLNSAEVLQRTLRRQLAVGVPLLLIGTVALIWMVVRGAMRQVDRLRAEVDAVSPTSLDARVTTPRTDDELGRLARTMNELLERLQRSSARQIRFVSDASHELRSPLASNRTRMEVALRAPDGVDWPTVARGVLAENGRMERMVRDLLFLARSDSGPSDAGFGPTDLDDVVMQEIESVRTFSRVPIDGSQVSAARVHGNADQLRRVVANLLDNAQRHASRSVTVKVSRADSMAELRVTDDGPGIAPADRGRIFDRFTRIDDARSRSGGGAGLGLAIVTEIVATHRGTVYAVGRDDDVSGAVVVVALPLAE